MPWNPQGSEGERERVSFSHFLAVLTEASWPCAACSSLLCGDVWKSTLSATGSAHWPRWGELLSHHTATFKS